MYRVISAVLRNECGSAFVSHVIIGIMAAMTTAGIWQAATGTPGQLLKNTVQDVSFTYSEGFEKGMDAGWPEKPAPGVRKGAVRSEAAARRGLARYRPSVALPTATGTRSGSIASTTSALSLAIRDVFHSHFFEDHASSLERIVRVVLGVPSAAESLPILRLG